MLEFLFLLLPIAVSYGWYMGRKNMQENQKEKANFFSKKHLTGINFLFSNQKNKVIDVFLDMLKEETTAIEAHLTLGNIFRSQGEVDRAIHIHQLLMKNTLLTFKQRLLAIHQLGLDYMAAGFYDRAEDIFNQLVAEDDFSVSALSLLLQIHQLTSEWLKAIEVAEKLIKLGKEHRRVEITHFYCELALQAMRIGNITRALLFLKKGEVADKNSARVSLMRGSIYMAQKDYADAVSELTLVLDQDREMVTETLPMLKTCYQKLEQPNAWSNFLKRCVEKKTGSLAEILLIDIIEQEQGPKEAQDYINQQLRLNPTMRMFHKLMNFHISEAEEGYAKESLETLRDIFNEQIQTKPRYHCHKCGFTSHNLYWHCLSCKSWASVKPIRGLNGQ